MDIERGNNLKMSDKNQTFARFSMMVGEEGIEKLRKSRVIIFGVGGVGSYTVEALVRAGVGQITMVDFDEISESNINRQLHSLRSTIGKSKIDVIGSKINLIEYCVKNNINIISSMGFGNKMHPEMIEIAKIKNTSVCPMARTIRSILKKKGITNVPVAFSKEIPVQPNKSELFKEEMPTEFRENNKIPRKTTPGSNSFVPGAAGLVLASYVVRKLLEWD